MLDVVMIVSLGPGDPELITLKGLNVLKKADFIYCPATILQNGNRISRSGMILNALGINDPKIIFFDVTMNENHLYAIKNYHDIAGQIEAKYRAGFYIALTAEGDAGFYSSSYYISEILAKKQLPVERIAGIPAFIACAASENVCISRQKEEVNIVTSLSSVEELQDKTRYGRTVVIMKPSLFEDVIKEALHKITDDISFHYFENNGVPEKEYYTNRRSDIECRHFPYFSLLIIQ